MTVGSLLAVIPARGGSKGLPGKNIRRLVGLPLIAHSILCAKMCPEIDTTVVSTDSEEIAQVARDYGAEVPFIRPAELATDTAPSLGVIQHALREMETLLSKRFEMVLLLDPTSPGRLPDDVAGAIGMLNENPTADGVVGVSEPSFNPLWHSVVLNDSGFMAPLIEGADRFTRRQQLPKVLRINATLYLFKREYLLSLSDSWMCGRLLMLEVPDIRAFHIDHLDDFELAQLILENRVVDLPWLEAS